MKESKQDTTLIVIAVAALLIVAQLFVWWVSQPQAAQRRVVNAGAQGDIISSAAGQDLIRHRQGFEDHVRHILFVGDHEPGSDQKLAKIDPQERRKFFSESAWQEYQQYLASRQAALGPGQNLIAEFSFGSQKYVPLVGNYTEFSARGVFCLSADEGYKCGPERFHIKLLAYGDLAKPAKLIIEEWQIAP